MNKLVISGRLIIWLFLLQEFNVTILDKPGKANIVVDFLSRISYPNDSDLVDYAFLDE